MPDPRRRFTKLRLTSAALGAVVASLLGTGAAAAAAPWEAPQNLSAAGNDGFLDQVGIDAGGEAVALWDCFSCGGPAAVQSSNRPPGGSWTPLLNRDPASVNGTYVPDLAVAPNGFAGGAWWRGGFGVNHVIMTAFRSGGAWSGVLAVTDEEEGEQEGKAFTGGYFPHIAVNSKGDAVVVWQECFSPQDLPTPEEIEEGLEFASPACATEGFEEIGRYVLRAAYRPAGGSWSAPQSLSKVAETAIKAKVAIDDKGNAIVVWEGDEMPFNPNNSPKFIYAGVLRAGESKWSVERITPLTGEAGEPQIAFDAAGNATALFHFRPTPASELLVESRVLKAGETSWSSPVQVSQAGQSYFEPQLAVNGAGAAVAIWRGNTTNRIEAKLRIGGVWSAFQQSLSPETLVAREPRLDVDSAGDAVALWRANAAKRLIQSSLLPAGGVWSAPIDLSDVSQNAEEPDLEMNAGGSAAATWRRFNGSKQIVQSSYLSAELRLQAHSIPADAAAGTPVHFSVSPVALWPGITTTWHFGDGKTATGENVSHTYAKGGTYKVTATSTDGPGNSASATGTIVVARGIARSPRLLKVIGGRAWVPLRCARVATCDGTLKLVRGPKAKRKVLGKASFVIAAGRQRTLKVALVGKRNRDLLPNARGHQLGAVLEGTGVQRRAVLLKELRRRR